MVAPEAAVRQDGWLDNGNAYLEPRVSESHFVKTRCRLSRRDHKAPMNRAQSRPLHHMVVGVPFWFISLYAVFTAGIPGCATSSHHPHLVCLIPPDGGATFCGPAP